MVGIGNVATLGNRGARSFRFESVANLPNEKYGYS